LRIRGGVMNMTNHPNRKKPAILTDKDRRNGAHGLRFDAHLAYLDGRLVRAKQLNRKADMLDKETV
jgi:hypothetical protein